METGVSRSALISLYTGIRLYFFDNFLNSSELDKNDS